MDDVYKEKVNSTQFTVNLLISLILIFFSMTLIAAEIPQKTQAISPSVNGTQLAWWHGNYHYGYRYYRPARVYNFHRNVFWRGGAYCQTNCVRGPYGQRCYRRCR